MTRYAGQPRRIQVSVYPALVPNTHVLANVNDVFNAVFVRGDVVGDTLFYGRGAGKDATASAVLSDLADAALDLKFRTHTYAGFQGEILSEDIRRAVGIFDANSAPAITSSTPEELKYAENSAAVTINQLLSDEWSLGTRYKFTQSRLHTAFPALADAVNTSTESSHRADLHELDLYAMFNHPSGFFARAESQWYWQHNSGYNPTLPGDEFVQINLFVGYRFPRQHGEFSVGLLNVTDRDYKLNPLNPYVELPRERVVATRLRFRF